MKKKLITCRKCHGETCKECNFTGKIKNPKLEEDKPTIRIMANGVLLLIKGKLDAKWLSDEFDKLTKPYGVCYPVKLNKETVVPVYQLYPYVTYAEFSAINSLV